MEQIGEVRLIAKTLSDISPKEMKAVADEFKNQYSEKLVVALLAANGGKSSAVIAVSDDLKDRYSAVDLVKVVAPHLGAQGGGGRADMAQTGGSDTEHFAEAVAAVRQRLA